MDACSPGQAACFSLITGESLRNFLSMKEACMNTENQDISSPQRCQTETSAVLWNSVERSSMGAGYRSNRG